MKFLSPVWTSLLVVMCTSCGSHQAPEASEATQGSDSSAAAQPSIESPIGLEADGSGGGNTSGITPMDVTTGKPTAPTPPQTSGTEASSIPTPAFPESLSDGSRTFRVLRTGKAAPGEGPRGPDGKVVDPQTYLEQLRKQKAQEAAKDAPQPPSRPTADAIPPSVTREIKRLDPSEAPNLPGTSARQKDE